MTSLVAVVMLLAFLMGLGYTTPGHLSKKCDGDPWEELFYKSAKVSQDNCEVDPWGRELNKDRTLQKKYEVAPWDEECR